MLSLSDNEFSVISFLVRNFTEKLTIRNIAQRLKFSAAGVFNILKKLEKQNIVIGEKLGTGLFYTINLESRVACHLAAIVLVYSEELPEKINVEELRQAKSAIFDKKNLLLITDNVTVINVEIPGINVISKTEDDIIGLLRRKEPEMLQLLKRGTTLFGEDKVVEIIKKCVSRF